MDRRLLPVLFAACVIASGCAGPTRLAEISGEKLADGDMWRAWSLATKALDKAPANVEARQAAAEAAAAISEDWQRRIHALANTDSMAAAREVLEFTKFRTGAARYALVPMASDWPASERDLRLHAARTLYEEGAAAYEAQRPKAAWTQFSQVGDFVKDYRDAGRLATRTFEEGVTRVAFVPFRVTSGPLDAGREAADLWAGAVTQRVSAPQMRFTRILPVEEIERRMRLSDLGRVRRGEARILGERAGAERVVWGTIGEVKSQSGIRIFTDVVARRIVQRDQKGRRTVHWVDVPIEVVARHRTVEVDVDYEIISTRDGAALARGTAPCRTTARAVWTAYVPEGRADSYVLVSDELRKADPARARRIESRWAEVVGEGTTLAEVLGARTAGADDHRAAIARFMAGAAFAFLHDLPPTEELAQVAIGRGWRPVYDDFVRLDGVDDVDLGVRAAGD